MNKKLLIFGLFVFIAGLMAISYVSAEQYIELDGCYESGGAISNCEVPITDAEHKVLKEGKSISKTVKISKEVKKYGKSKTKTFKTMINKKTMKKQIKKAVKGKSVDTGLNEKLYGAKISKITFRNIKIKDKMTGDKYKALKIIIKYKPCVWKTVTKTTKATIKLDDDDYATINYINPFNNKKETEYGELVYY